MPTTINTKGNSAYGHVSQCIQEFEEAALRSGTRAGYMAVAYGATHAPDTSLDAHERTLSKVSSARSRVASRPENPGERPTFESINKEGLQLVDTDIDLNTLFGNSDSAFANYLADCIGCNLRLKFDWQLKPLNLLLPINGFLDDLFGALDRLLARALDPWRILEDICWALNHLKMLCPQDLILVLLALKMLLKKYLLQMFNIKLDWTVLLGPLLKALVSALTDLLDNIFAILMAPLDCAISGLKAANDLIAATNSLVAEFGNAANQVDNFFDTLNANGPADAFLDTEHSGMLFKDATWVTPSDKDLQGSALLPGNQGIDPGRLDVVNRLEPLTEGTQLGNEDEISRFPENNTLRIPTGFVLTPGMTTLDAIRDPNFINSTWLEKLILLVSEAIAWLRETYEKFVGALRSLEGLVSGSIGLSLDNIGIMLFITDMIALVLMIINLLKMNVDVKDWCSFLQKNPQLLDEQIKTIDPRASVLARGVGNDAELLIKRGPDIVGTVQTCVSNRSTDNSRMINQWIQEIEARGANV